MVSTPHPERITNNEVRSRTQQPLLSDAVRSKRLRFFGHICRADPCQDHSRALVENDTATQSGSGDSSTACSEQNSLADTRGNGYVADKLRVMMMMMMMIKFSMVTKLGDRGKLFTWFTRPNPSVEPQKGQKFLASLHMFIPFDPERQNSAQ